MARNFESPPPISGLLRLALRDMVESNLIFCSGSETDAVYRIATPSELRKIRDEQGQQGIDEIVWAIIYREGPIYLNRLKEISTLSSEALEEVLQRLISSERIQSEQRMDGPVFSSKRLFVKLGSSYGWEASVYDHFHAMVKTVCNRLEKDNYPERLKERIGGSTYTMEVAPGHPMEAEVLNTLQEFRTKCSTLGERVATYNRQHGLGDDYEGVVIYFGQSVILHEQNCEQTEHSDSIERDSTHE